MTDVVNTGTADQNDGDPVKTAFDLINDALDALDAVTPVVVDALEAPTLTGDEIEELSDYGVVIGTFPAIPVGATRQIIDRRHRVYLDADGITLKKGRAVLSEPSEPTFDIQVLDKRRVGTAETGYTYEELRSPPIPITVTAMVGRPTFPAADMYFAPAGMGTQTGLSAANAKPISALAAIVNAATTGIVCGLLADQGEYTEAQITLTTIHTNTASPIIIRGMGSDNTPMPVWFVGTRFDWDCPAFEHSLGFPNPIEATNIAGLEQGNRKFVIRGTGCVTLDNMGFERIGNAVNFDASSIDTHHVSFTNFYYYNVRYLIDHGNTGSGTAKHIHHITIDGVYGVGNSKPIVRFRGINPGDGAHDIIERNIYCNLGRQTGDNYSAGLRFDGTAHDILVENFALYAGHDDQGSSYWQAEGLGAEGGNYNAVIQNGIVAGFTDAGMDWKGYNTTITNLLSYDNKRNIRLWHHTSVLVDDSTFRDPHKRGSGSGSMGNVWLRASSTTTETRANVLFVDCTFENGAFQLGESVGNTVLNLVDCTETNTTDVVYATSKIQRGTAEAAPPVITSDTLVGGVLQKSTLEGSLYSYTPTFEDDDDNPATVTAEIISNPDGAFSLTNIFSFPLKMASQPYTPGGDNLRQATLRVFHIDKRQYVDIPVEVTVLELTDAAALVFDVTFVGANNSQTAVDTKGHALSWGANAKIQNNRLVIPFTVNGSGVGRVSAADSTEWTPSGPFAAAVDNIDFDITARGTTQIVLCHHGASGEMGWRMGVNAAGYPFLNVSADGSASTVSITGLALAALGDDFRWTAELVSGATYRYKLWVNGVSVGTPVDSSMVPYNAVGQLSIGARGNSNDYMGGKVDRVRAWKGKAVLP